jgi:hypothetical protein
MNIHDGRKMKDPTKKPFNIILFYHNNRKNIKRLLFIILFIIILFFPTWSAGIIGTWVKEFFGTILNIINTL